MAHGNPVPWLRKGRGWFVTIGGKQVNLRAQSKREAYAAWRAILAAPPATAPSGAQSVADDPLVVSLLALFCDWAEKRLAPKTYDWYRRYLHEFVRFLPDGLTVSQLKPLLVTQ